MNLTIHRLLGPGMVALLLAATIGAGSAIAAPMPAAPQAVAAPGAGPVQCAAAWETARGDPTVATLQAVGRCEVDRRLATLSRLQAAVDRSKVLADDHEATLDAVLASTTAGLTALRGEISAATTVAALRGQIRQIFEDYRVYLLVARQTWLVIADDMVDTVAGRLARAAGWIEDEIGAAEANGLDVADARAHLVALRASIDVASTAVAGDAEAVLALKPADWSAGEAAPILRSARTSLLEARSALRTALRQAHAALADLR